MKHAVLIMAHKNKEQLIRLIRALACDEFDFFVHPDVNWDLSSEDLMDIETCADNVHLASKRIHGELDHWSLPQITLNLIDDALKEEQKHDTKYSYFLLLSGQDYPIKSKSYILKFLEEQYPNPIIDIEAYSEKTWIASKFNLNHWIREIDKIHDKYSPGIIRKLIVSPYAIGDFLEKHFFGTPKQRLKKQGVELYGGSQWWILSHKSINAIQNRLNRKIYKAFKRAWTPEETFFQTMLMNSEGEAYTKDILHDNVWGEQNNMTYSNFITPKKGFIGHPHIITTHDFERIMGKNELFARKFDITIDEDIIDRIDEVIDENYS